MEKDIFIIGNFGYFSNDLNGQTVRSRTILQTLSKYVSDYDTDFLDTSEVKKKSLLFFFFKIFPRKFVKYTSSKNIILMPAQRMIKILTILNYFTKVLSTKKTHFIAIGGWLFDFLEKNPKYIKLLKKYDFIYVQTNSLKFKLKEIGLGNVVYFPNYRIYHSEISEPRYIDCVERIVYFSRVDKSKGVEIAINAISRLNSTYDKKIHLHIYGPITRNYEAEFMDIVSKTINVYYEGIVQPEDVITEISKYDLMVFPTFYEGEGFPGAILDSMFAAVPVICSDWKYNSEVLTNGFNGFLFSNKNVDDLIEKVSYLIDNPDMVNKMKVNSLEESKKYSESNVSSILINNIRGGK